MILPSMRPVLEDMEHSESVRDKLSAAVSDSVSPFNPSTPQRDASWRTAMGVALAFARSAGGVARWDCGPNKVMIPLQSGDLSTEFEKIDPTHHILASSVTAGN